MMNGDLAQNAVRVKGDYLRGKDLWERLPDFHYQVPSTASVVARLWSGFGLLALWTAGMSLAAWMLASRMGVD